MRPLLGAPADRPAGGVVVDQGDPARAVAGVDGRQHDGRRRLAGGALAVGDGDAAHAGPVLRHGAHRAPQAQLALGRGQTQTELVRGASPAGLSGTTLDRAAWCEERTLEWVARGGGYGVGRLAGRNLLLGPRPPA